MFEYQKNHKIDYWKSYMQPYNIGEVSEKNSFLSRGTVPLNAVTFRWIPQVNWQNVHDETNYSD
jgi:hypothetical protein